MVWLPKEKVIAPIEGNKSSTAAIDAALQIARRPHDVHVVHVLAPLPVTEPGVVWGTVDDESRREHATQAIRDDLTDPKYDAVQIHIEIGDPGRRIAELAERIEAELVVIPSHGRTGLSRLMIGSTAERVIRLCHCPVLVLRA